MSTVGGHRLREYQPAGLSNANAVDAILIEPG
jgi:hypothetical protein